MSSCSCHPRTASTTVRTRWRRCPRAVSAVAEVADVCVLGSGGVGSAAAASLARVHGLRVTVLDAAESPVEAARLGSSGGESRIFRRIDLKEHVGRMSFNGAPLWRELEEACGLAPESLLRVTGGVELCGPAAGAQLAQLQAVAEETQLSAELRVLEGRREIEAAVPALRVGPGYTALLDQEGAGIVNPEATMAACRALAARHGATISHGATVTSIEDRGDSFTVRYHIGTAAAEAGLEQRTIECERLLVTAGAWTGDVLHTLLGVPRLSLEVWEMTYGFFRVEPEHLHKLETMPVWRHFGGDARERCYGIGVHEMGGCVKSASHLRHRVVDNLSARGFVPDSEAMDELAAVLTSCVFGDGVLADGGRRAAEVTCLYTMTPDEEFAFGAVPGFETRVFAFTGCNGSGFKHVPLLGRAAADVLAGVGDPKAPRGVGAEAMRRFALDREALMRPQPKAKVEEAQTQAGPEV